MQSGNKLFDQYRNSKLIWKDNINKLLGLNAELVGISPFNTNARVYRYGQRIFIRKLGNHETNTALHSEYLVLDHLEKTNRYFKFAPEYKVLDEYEILSINYVNGYSIERILEIKSLKLTYLIRIFFLILSINLCGISHRDITTDNIIINEYNDLVIIDFDRAVFMGTFASFINDMLGVGKSQTKAIHPFRRLLQRVLYYKNSFITKYRQ